VDLTGDENSHVNTLQPQIQLNTPPFGYDSDRLAKARGGIDLEVLLTHLAGFPDEIANRHHEGVMSGHGQQA
jgi:hypothetical protein